MKNVLFIAYHFPPSGGPGVQRSAKFVKYLPQFGWQPLVLTAAEQDIEYLAKDRTLLDDMPEASIVRCRGFEQSLLKLVRRAGLRPVTALLLRPDKNVLGWCRGAARAARRLAARERIEAIYTSLGPFSSALLGARLKRALGVPWVADFRDPWTDDGMGVWPTRLHYFWECRQERRALQEADAVIVVTPGMRQMMVDRYPALADRVHLIPNGFDREDFAAGSAGPRADGVLRIAYTGAAVDYDFPRRLLIHGPATRLWNALIAYRPAEVDFSTHSPLYLLRAVRRLLDERPELAGKIELCFAGAFGEGNRTLIRRLNLEGAVKIKGYLPHAQSINLLLESDVLFLPMTSFPDGRRNYLYSGKVFEYLAARRPILALVPEGDLTDLIGQTTAGWCVDPRDTTAIKSLLVELIARKQDGSLSVESDPALIAPFERSALTERLAAVLDRVAACSRFPCEDVQRG